MAETKAKTPKPQTKLELREKLHLLLESDGKRYTFLSRVIEQTKKKLIIEYPTALEGGGILMAGDRVEVTITRSDAVWGFTTRILEKIAGQRPTMTLAAPQTLERNQRRRYVRVDWLAVCRWTPIRPPKTSEDMSPVLGPEAEGTIHNISAGGVLMAADNPPPVGEYVILKPQEAKWPLPGAVLGRIVWRRRLPPEHKYDTQIGVDFRDLPEVTSGWTTEQIEKLSEHVVPLTQTTRHYLMQFIYRRQIELRNKGAI